MDEITLIEPEERIAVPGRSLATTATPSDLLRIAVEQGADLDKLERLMLLQERWEAKEAKKAYDEAMAEFKAEAIEIIKRKQVDFQTQKGRTQYKHAELSDVIDAVGPALSKHGFSWSWTPKQDRTWVEITCTLKHRLGHSESVSLGAPPDESGGKNTIQSIISTKTYLERHTLKAICGVAEKGEDNDGRGAPAAAEIPPELLTAARTAALEGWKSLSAFIKNRSEEELKLLDPESDRLKAAAKSADSARTPK
jgi:hypothetical protein